MSILSSKTQDVAPDIAAVLFDMDGLLLDTEAGSRDLWVRVAAEFGYVLSHEAYAPVIGTNAAGTIAILRRALGSDAPVERMLRVKQERAAAQVIDGDIRAKPGVDALLDTLTARGVTYAVATSTAHAVARSKLSAAGYGSRFATLIGGDQVARGKPAPDLFLAAAQALGIDPARCLALEDSLNGLRAAHAAGMRVIMVPDLIPPDDEARRLAWRVLPTLDAVRQNVFQVS
jgi:HAD superfamily hydrolase (TIGR01509 family)